MPLNNTTLRNLRPAEKPFKRADDRGLYVMVKPSGSVLWRMDYRIGGKRKTISFGAFPEISLTDARDRREAARLQIARGEDPMLAQAHAKARAKVAKAPVTDTAQLWDNVSQDYLKLREREGFARQTASRLRIMVRKLDTALCGKRVQDIGASDVRPVLEREIAADRIATANEVRRVFGQVMDYAEGWGMIDQNPAYRLSKVVPSYTAKHHPAITDKDGFGKLMRDIAGAERSSPRALAAIRLQAHVFLRPTELVCGHWREIDWDARLWSIPAERMKGRKSSEHIVPLSQASIMILREIRASHGHPELIFPAVRTGIHGPMTGGGLNDIIHRVGYSQRHTLHSFRSTASTNLNEMGFNGDWVEAQLAHAERNQTRASYNSAQYLAQRTEMMSKWSEWVDEASEVG